ncbi:hypothetical protein C4J89_2716 [Pseudomonas sp. R4-35-07]|nr:hypothetical protein C4J91_2756 [Pseudomonas sp. R3-52-08]AZF26839.1 hypothetical protein C4J90_2666 [Pseudomonas sp. R2-60-08W]AZF32191.1 hypothetical protein C4J89_2716 [Pseudomonas sp. R4-35-07]
MSDRVSGASTQDNTSPTNEMAAATYMVSAIPNLLNEIGTK